MTYVLQNFERIVLAVLLAAVAVLVFVGVVSRYFLHQSLSYLEELVRYLFVWATFIGAAAATKERAHLGLSLLPERLNAGWRRRLDYLVGVVMIGFFGCVAVLGAQTVWLQRETGQTTAALGWPMWWVGLSVPVGSVLVIIRVVGWWTGSSRGERGLP